MRHDRDIERPIQGFEVHAGSQAQLRYQLLSPQRSHQDIVCSGSGWYSSRMNRISITARSANLAASMRRARELYEKAEQSLTDPALPENVRDAAHATKNFAALAVLALSSGRVADGNAMQSFTVEAWGEAKRLTLLPAAKRGQPMIDGPKQPRCDNLRLCMEKAIEKLPEKHTWRDVLAKIAEIDIDQKIIHSIDYKEENIEWFDGKNVRDTDFHQFRKRLTRIRGKNKIG